MCQSSLGNGKEGNTTKMNVLDLFSGLEGWSKPFKDRGHETITVDINPKFNPTICKDIFDLNEDDLPAFWQPDIILASPPCNCFSIASVYRHWDKNTKRPKDNATKYAIDLVAYTINFILTQYPRWWILENPRGMLRHVLGKPQVTTYFASWQSWEEVNESHRAFHDVRKPCFKPTDLWGILPNVKWDEPMEWAKAPRGAKEGIQGIKDRDIRAKIPYGLALAICLACEKELESQTKLLK